VVSGSIVYTKQAQTDTKKLAAAGLKTRAQRLLELLAEDPLRNPPAFEKLIGDLKGAFRVGSTSSAACSIRCWKRKRL
jgi:Txe/YoeB family toxin of Txe-Axe toxin-antitoxin module